MDDAGQPDRLLPIYFRARGESNRGNPFEDWKAPGHAALRMPRWVMTPIWEPNQSIETFLAFLFASSVFGIRISRIPSLNFAFASSVRTSDGRPKERVKDP